GLSLDYDKDAFSGSVRDELLKRERVVIGIRPYAVRRSKDGVPATVSANQWLGDQTHIAADFAGGSLVLVEHDRTRLELGAPINISIDPKNLHVFDQSSGMAISHGMELA
ncbi:MAG: TOBE domain-containing protein, partial [Mesorhizobium sp.]